jgi:hypothetical protein
MTDSGSVECPAGVRLSIGAERIRAVVNLSVDAIPTGSIVTLDGCIRGIVDIGKHDNTWVIETLCITATMAEALMPLSIVSVEKSISIAPSTSGLVQTSNRWLRIGIRRPRSVHSLIITTVLPSIVDVETPPQRFQISLAIAAKSSPRNGQIQIDKGIDIYLL